MLQFSTVDRSNRKFFQYTHTGDPVEVAFDEKEFKVW